MFVVEAVTILQSPKLDSHNAAKGRTNDSSWQLVLRHTTSEQINVVHVTVTTI